MTSVAPTLSAPRWFALLIGVLAVVSTPALGANPAASGGAAAHVTANAPNTWSPTGSMTTARSSHTATLLPGGRVLVTGGIDQNYNAVASAELYNPTTGTWTARGSMTTARQSHTATLLPSGKVLVAGGCGDQTCGQSLASAELYDPATGTFTATGSMSNTRYNHTATLLPSGLVLIAGGCNYYGCYTADASAELYNPRTGVFTPTGSMTTPRWSHTATLLANGKVLVVGGRAGGNNPIASAELYDPTTGTWTATGSVITGRDSHTATLLASGPNTGKVLVAGGEDTNFKPLASAELYDPTTGTWTATGSMTTARLAPTATLLPNGAVLVAGGCGAPSSCTTMASAELYDPNTGLWTDTGSMSTARLLQTATLLPDGSVLVAGGGNDPTGSLASAELYNTSPGPLLLLNPNSLDFGNQAVGTSATQSVTLTNTGAVTLTVSSIALSGTNSADFATTDTCVGAPIAPASHCALVVRFTPSAFGRRDASVSLTDDAPTSPQSVPLTGYGAGPNMWAPTGSMADGRDSYTATLLPNGQVLIAGGGTGCDMLGCYTLSSAELYDPTTGAWRRTGSMTIARQSHTATLLPNGKVLVAGGSGDTSAELYDPATGTFTATGSMSATRFNHTATLLPSGQVLVAGGSGNTSAELYNPRTGTWTATGNMTTARSSHTATLLSNGKVLVAGGDASAELYDPATGTFTATGSMSATRFKHTATLLPSGQVLVAGGCCDPTSGQSLASAELYDPNTGTWTSTGSMLTARQLHTATLLPTGQVLAAGGCCPADYYRFNSAELYIPLTLAISPTTALVGQTLAVTGSAFTPGEPVTLYWDTPSSTTTLTTTSAAAAGTIAATVTVPPATAGRHTLIARGHTSTTAAFAFVRVTPRLLLAPAAGPPGALARVVGLGFGGTERVWLSWDTPRRLLGATTSDARGSFYGRTGVTIRVPQGAAAGMHVVYGLGQRTHALGVGFFTVR